MDTPLAICDTETTEINNRRLPWEIAVIRRNPDGTRREHHAYVAVDLADASPFSLQIGGFYDRHPLGRYLSGKENYLSTPGCLLAGPAMSGIPMATVSDVIADPMDPTDEKYRALYLTQEDAALAWCRWTHGAHIVGAVPSFDVEVMATASRAAGLIGGHHYHLTDTSTLILGWLRGYIAANEVRTLTDEEHARLDDLRAVATIPYRSDDLMAALGIVVPDEDRHTALGDARACERVLCSVLGLDR